MEEKTFDEIHDEVRVFLEENRVMSLFDLLLRHEEVFWKWDSDICYCRSALDILNKELLPKLRGRKTQLRSLCDFWMSEDNFKELRDSYLPRFKGDQARVHLFLRQKFSRAWLKYPLARFENVKINNTEHLQEKSARFSLLNESLTNGHKTLFKWLKQGGSRFTLKDFFSSPVSNEKGVVSALAQKLSRCGFKEHSESIEDYRLMMEDFDSFLVKLREDFSLSEGRGRYLMSFFEEGSYFRDKLIEILNSRFWLMDLTIPSKNHPFDDHFPRNEYFPFLSLKEAKEIFKERPELKVKGHYIREYHKIDFLPSNPSQVYKNWINWNDFAGLDDKNYYSTYEEAKESARSLGFKTMAEYKNGGYKTDPRLPSNPQKFYEKKGWLDWYDFLGNGRDRAVKRTNWMSYELAKSFIQKQKLRNCREFRSWTKTENRPDNFPTRPDKVYRDEFEGYKVFLGNG